MINKIEEKVGVYTYYDILSLPFDRDINYPYEITYKNKFSKTHRTNPRCSIISSLLFNLQEILKLGD